MPTKKTDAGVEYEVDDKKFTWHPEDDNGNRAGGVVIPLRIKLKLIRSMADRELDSAAMFDMLSALAPNQQDVLDDMDVNDFQEMFTTWQSEYNALTGASLGESSSSSA